MIFPPTALQLLCTLTLIEGEGLGMAYEYFVRRQLLLNWYRTRPRPQRMLIAGLPEKHGFAFDFFLLAQEWSAQLVVADERPQRLEKCQRLVAAAQHQGYFHNLAPTYLPVTDLIHLPELQQTFDLALSAELLQRIPSEWVPRYWRTLCQRAKAIALFAPNADNPAHQLYSHIPGLYLDDMHTIALMAHQSEVQVGYLDVPPFPPGVSRSSSQRQQVTVGLFSQLGIWLLELYARLEPYFGRRWSRGRAHTVYALAASAQ